MIDTDKFILNSGILNILDVFLGDTLKHFRNSMLLFVCLQLGPSLFLSLSQPVRQIFRVILRYIS